MSNFPITLSDCVFQSFMTEVNALKPGNVSRYADGHEMSLADFRISAEVSTPILTDKTLGVGERIYRSVEQTRASVFCNTNLGMLLLFAPLIRAAELSGSGQSLRQRLADVLATLDQEDSARIFAAIKLANPGGLGNSERHDVHNIPDISVQEAMSEAQNRDRIALQYVTHFEDIFELGLPSIKDYILRWNRVEWAAAMCFMQFLRHFDDSHIVRKYGEDCAGDVRIKSIQIAESLSEQEKPESMVTQLLEFDEELKKAKINPGTTADLTAASILVYYLDENNF